MASRCSERPDHYDDLVIDLDDEVLGLVVTDLDPERGWGVVIELLGLAETDHDIRIIATALLEPLLREHGPRFVMRTEVIAEVASRLSLRNE